MWDDLRLFLAVQRAGTLSGAAQALGIDQSTVTRRLQGMERRLGVALLARRDGRYAPTVAGRAVVARAESVEREIDAILGGIAHADERPAGTVRLSAPEGLGLSAIAPRLATFHATHPQIDLVLAAETTVANLSRRDADLALRLVPSRQRELKVRRIAWLRFGLYAAPSYLERRPRRGRLVLPDDDVVLFHPELRSLEARWARGTPARARVLVRNPLALRDAVAAGAGVGLLGDYLARPANLVRLDADVPERPLFLVAHRAVSGTSRVRAVARFVEESLLAAKV